jgi:hypothetical protein
MERALASPVTRPLLEGPVFACAVAALLHAPAFRYELISDDEAIYDAMAQVVSRGGVMYRDAVDHKPPGLVYAYASVRSLVEHFAGSFQEVLFGVHLLGLLVAMATCAVLYAIGRHVLEKQLWPLPPLLYALLSASNQPPDSLAVNGELLMNLPTVLAVWLALEAGRRKGASGVLLNVVAGSMCGVAALFKYQAALIGIALLALPLAKGSVRVWAARALALGAGLMLPLGAAAFFFWRRGALDDAIAWGIEFNRSYIAEGPDLWTAVKRFSLQFFGMVVPNFVVFGAGLGGFARLVRRFIRPETDVCGVVGARAMMVVWTLESLFCVCLGRRFFGHYFLQPELPLAILAAGPIAALWRTRPRLILAGVGLPVLVFFLIAALPEYTRRIVYMIDPDYRTVGEAARERSQPSDSIWVWGNVPQIYYSAQRMPGVRFPFCNYLTGLSPGTRSEYDPSVDPRDQAVESAWKLVVQDLDTRRPALVLDTAAADMKFYGKFPIKNYEVLDRYLKLHYRPEGTVKGVVFYRRVNEG